MYTTFYTVIAEFILLRTGNKRLFYDLFRWKRYGRSSL